MNNNLSANIGCKLVEEFIFIVSKRFCEDLIRDTCSNTYHEFIIINIVMMVLEKQIIIII